MKHLHIGKAREIKTNKIIDDKRKYDVRLIPMNIRIHGNFVYYPKYRILQQCATICFYSSFLFNLFCISSAFRMMNSSIKNNLPYKRRKLILYKKKTLSDQSLKLIDLTLIIFPILKPIKLALVLKRPIGSLLSELKGILSILQLIFKK